MDVRIVRTGFKIGLPVKVMNSSTDRLSVSAFIMPYSSCVWIRRRNFNEEFTLVNLVVTSFVNRW